MKDSVRTKFNQVAPLNVVLKVAMNDSDGN